MQSRAIDDSDLAYLTPWALRTLLAAQYTVTAKPGGLYELGKGNLVTPARLVLVAQNHVKRRTGKLPRETKAAYSDFRMERRAQVRYGQ